MNCLLNYLQNYFPAHLLDSENSDKAVTEKAQKAKTILQQVHVAEWLCNRDNHMII